MRGQHRSLTTISGLVFAAIFILLALPVRAQSVASLPKPTNYVNDFAHVLSPGTIAQLDSICAQLDHSKANAQIAVVTVNSLDGDYAADYAYHLENKWKMGRKGSDRGVLVLLAIKDHKYRIEDGYGLEGLLNDAKIGDIGRTMIPDLKAGNYDGAVTLAVDQLARDIAGARGVKLNFNAPAPPPQPVEQGPQGSPILNIILFVVVMLFFGGFSILRMFLGAGLFFGGWGGPWMGGGFGGGMGGSGLGGGMGGGGDSGFQGFGGGSFGGGGAGGEW